VLRKTLRTLLPIFQSVPTNPTCAAARHMLTVAAMIASFAGTAYSILGLAVLLCGLEGESHHPVILDEAVSQCLERDNWDCDDE
jgi:hypothetical protein